LEELLLGGAKPKVEVDLDGPYGDPVVKWDPKFGWNGPSYVGSTFSQCPPEYLTALAKAFDAFAKKDKEAGKTFTNKKGQTVPSYTYKEKDAALARGWAERNKRQRPPEKPMQAVAIDEVPESLPF
jgi:hypothetical protein